MKYVCTDGRKKGRKERRWKINLSDYIKEMQSSVYTTIPKDTWLFPLFNKKKFLVCV